MRLVGIAEVGRDPGQVAIPGRHGRRLRYESPEAEHPVECLRAVADSAVEPAPELAIADPQGARKPVDAAAGEAEAARGREDEWIGFGRTDSRCDECLEQIELGFL